MNPSDEKTLQDFLGQLIQARGVTKDPDADALIQRAVAQQPDAAYLLVQRALLVEQALGNAKARIAELENKGGFLDANSWGNSSDNKPAASAPPEKRGSFLGGAGGSMLGTIAATAAGVAAGSFLFHGIGNLLGNDEQGGASHLLAENATAGESGALADQAGIGAIDEPGAADDPIADANHEDEPGGFFDGDGSDEGLFG